MGESDPLCCDTCGKPCIDYIGKQEPNDDPMGRAIYAYQCENGHITKRIKWGKKSISNLFLRVAKLEKALQEKQ